MKRFFYFGLVFVLLFTLAGVVGAESGPLPDKIYFDVRMQEEIGIQDTAEGRTDLFMHGVDAPLINGLDDSTLNKLDIYNIPSSSWALSINPIPDKAPYTWEVDGEEKFNAFAIKDVRFALNFLINRQYLVDEILDGAGGPMYSAITPVAPGSYRYNLMAAEMGFTPEGDEEYALNMIEEAMQEAAEIEYNQGRLVKEDGWWTYDGEPITIKFVIRADDPNGRMRVGEYVSQQLEKAGIQVERLVWDRVRATETWLYGDPANFEWQMYTDGWGAGGTYQFHQQNIAQMYAPWFGYMPGGTETDRWSYEHEELDELTQQLQQGNFLTEEEYWDLVETSLEMGLSEANRIYLAYSNVTFVANKQRFENRMAYGLGDGLNEWSLQTANTQNNILNVTQFSARGGLFMDSWNPVGSTGFGDTYSINIASALTNPSTFATPSAAEWVGHQVEILDYEKDLHREVVDGDEVLVGDIELPAEAIKYDSQAQEWVSAEGETSISKGKYRLVENTLHHGEPLTIIDYIFAEAFTEDWINEDYEGDLRFDQRYSSYLKGQSISVAYEYDLENGEIISYFDYNFPPSEQRAAANGAPTWFTTAAGQNVNVTWEIVEALARIVVNGGEVSGENYSFSSGVEGAIEVDIINQSCVTDIKAELEKMREEEYIPVYIEDFVDTAYVLARYDAAIDFIEEYNHAYISNGPFYISDFDTGSNFMELSAHRDGYPYSADYWIEVFETERLVINEVDAPVMAEAGENIDINIYVSQTTYPETTENPVDDGTVELILITGDEEISFEAEQIIDGMFMGRIPAEVTENLEPDNYSIVTTASAGNAVPSTAAITITIY